MKRKSIGICIAISLVAVACSGPRDPAPSAPGPEAQRSSPMQVQAPPVHALIGHRDRLALTSEQVTALDSIGMWLHAENSPRLAELRAAVGSGARGRTGGQFRMGEEARLLFEQIAERNQEAVAGVRSVLNEEQEARVCELFAESRTRRASEARAAPRGAPRATGEAMPVPLAWSWCVPAAPGTGAGGEQTPDA